MDFQTQNITIQLPHQMDCINSAFKHPDTAKLARVLVEMICRHEEPSNYDECIEALWLELGKKMDKKSGLPVSCLLLSDIEEKVVNKLASGHYRPIIQN